MLGSEGEVIERTCLFTNELYKETKHVAEQLSDQLAMARIDENHPWVFGVGDEFVTRSMEGEFDNTVIIMMGCSCLYIKDLAQAFIICIQGPSYPTPDCQNATSDGGVLTWDNLIPGSYNVTETGPGKEWAVNITGSPATVVSLETASANVTNTYGTDCVGLTPGYWKNWRNHYEVWEFQALVEPTFAGSIGVADAIFYWYNARPDMELTYWQLSSP